MNSVAYPSGAKLYDIPFFVDERGALNVIETARELPFTCQRVFYTYTVPQGAVRGEHAHKLCEEFLVSLRGAVSIVSDDGAHRDEFLLDSPSKGLWLPAGRWTEQFGHSPDSILLVLASRPYESEDYLRTYDDFKAWLSQGQER